MIKSLYLHIPFCRKKCDYCSFYSIEVGEDERRAEHQHKITHFVKRLQARIKVLEEAGLLASLDTVYVGGGTPSLLHAEDIASLLAPLAHHSFSEVTFEANPESLTEEFLAACEYSGVTRISLGIQSMVDSELRAIGRLANFEDNKHALELLEKANISFSADVMVGLPGQTQASLQNTIQALLSYKNAHHISVYPLSLEHATPLFIKAKANPALLPNQDYVADMMVEVDKILTSAGFKHYEIANYAQPGFEAQHNLSYWTGLEYLGLGPSASSMVSRTTYQNLCTLDTLCTSDNLGAQGDLCTSDNLGAQGDLCTQNNRIGTGMCLPKPQVLPPSISRLRMTEGTSLVEPISFELEGLTQEQSAAEDLMLRSRLFSGLGENSIQTARTQLGETRVEHALSSLVEDGLLTHNSAKHCYQPTEKGWLLGNVMFSKLWDLAPSSETFIYKSLQ